MAGKLTSYVWATNEEGENVLLKPGDSVPDWAAEQVTAPSAFDGSSDDVLDPDDIVANNTGEPSVAGEPVVGTFDPSESSVDEVNNYLAEHEDDEGETQRVIAAEAAGKARKGIVEGPYAPESLV